MSEHGLRKEIADAIERGDSIEEMVVILRKYRDQGTTAKQATEALEAMRAGADERTEDQPLVRHAVAATMLDRLPRGRQTIGGMVARPARFALLAARFSSSVLAGLRFCSRF